MYAFCAIFVARLRIPFIVYLSANCGTRLFSLGIERTVSAEAENLYYRIPDPGSAGPDVESLN